MERQYLKDYDPLDLNKEYTLTDVSRLPAAFASIKAVVDYITSWPESALYDWRNEFTIAASSCYQYVDHDPFYDICSYLTQLEEKVLVNDPKFIELAENAKKAIYACQAAHKEYSYISGKTKTEKPWNL